MCAVQKASGYRGQSASSRTTATEVQWSNKRDGKGEHSQSARLVVVETTRRTAATVAADGQTAGEGMHSPASGRRGDKGARLNQVAVTRRVWSSEKGVQQNQSARGNVASSVLAQAQRQT